MNSRACLAELIGTFALCFVGILSIAHCGSGPNQLGLLGIALAHGLTIACFATATMAISGGHFNPAVSLGFLITRRISVATCATYVISQLLGGFLAAVAARFIYVGPVPNLVQNGTPAPATGVSLAQSLVAEVIGTFLLMFVIYGTAVDSRAPKMGGLFIGFTVILCIFAIGPVSGAAMNPARWMGPALASGQLGNLALYWVGPVVGAALAALLYESWLKHPKA